MTTRPLDRLTSIRAKLGSTVVIAVGLALAISYVLIGFALRNSPRDSEAIDAISLARHAATGRLEAVPDGVMIVRLHPDGSRTIRGEDLGELPRLRVDVPRWGVVGANVFATVPTGDGGSATALIHSPSRGFLGRLSATTGFLQSVWWQFLLVGVVAASISLVVARFLARGMTQPLRDMAAAARQMEMGDYSVRVQTKSRDEVGKLAVAFNRMSEELEHLERSRRDLVANVSHELKTPIAAIRAHLENLLDGVEQPDPATLGVMLAQVERLGRLVDQLLDLSRLESGEVPLRIEALPLQPLVDDLISEIDVALAGREVEVRNVVSADLPALSADRERVHQVLFNLVDNAVRFTPDGGRVTISARRRNGSVEVAVADTGAGIAPEHLPRLFERFYRADAARTRGEGGTGIGLAIARSVVEAHGGRISAESEPGRGSVFTFDLPSADGGTG
ncbi:MAG TPA: HAMP domain-containing sensor histidine kinase [Actinomycetota bacterium]|nr:HAMP domain-containing sensor histidine kinase [Actinomycetota bacterium]